MRPLRILFLDYTNGIGLGGGQRSLALLIRHLPQERYQALVACPPGEQLRHLLPPPVPVLDLPLPPAFTSATRHSGSIFAYVRALAQSMPAMRSLRGLLTGHRIDIVHANNFKMHILASAATVGLGIPVLWHVRDIFPDRTVGLLRLAARVAKGVLPVSRAVAAQFGPEPHVKVLYNAVELPKGDDIRRTANAGVIGYVGRLDPGKGLDTLVAAFLSLLDRFPRARLLIAGEGPARASIPVHPSIEVMGFQSDVSAAWRRMDICVQPSSEPDSFPRSVIEAMSWGKPVIGAAIGGIPEAIDEGSTGLLFPPGDVPGLANLLNHLLENPDKARLMGEAGRRRCEEMFSVSTQIEQLTRIYESTYEIRNP